MFISFFWKASFESVNSDKMTTSVKPDLTQLHLFYG